jgi:predicted acyltransferase
MEIQSPPADNRETLEHERLASIDVLRGFDMFFLIGAGGILLSLSKAINSDAMLPIQNQLRHVAWAGFSAWDIIMPLLAGASLVAVYWFLMTFVPVSGFGSGVFTPEGNLAIYIDHAVFGRFDDGTQYTWLLTSLGFGVTVFSGYYAGWILKQPLEHNKKLKQISLIGVALILGGLLCSLQMPIIKKIWSCSMILFSSGVCYLLLALSYLVTDKWKINSWWVRGFRMFGLNALAAYMLSSVFSLNHVAGYLVHGLEQYTGAYYPFCVSLCEFAILFFIIRHMYRYKIFLKV